MNTRIINMTPHPINIMAEGGTTITLPPSGALVRVRVTREVAGYICHDGAEIPLHRTSYGAVEGLPAPEPGTLYIVSLAVRAACPGRMDLASPGELVRDAAGQPIGCRGLDVT
jgi:hypothetical protein